MLILNYFEFCSICLGINRFLVFWCCEITWIILTTCCMSILTYCWVAFLSRAFGCSLLNRPIPWRGEVWDLFRHLSNKTIYVKLRHHYFVAVLQAYTLYYAQDQQGWVLIYFFSCFHAKCTFYYIWLTKINNAVLFAC